MIEFPFNRRMTVVLPDLNVKGIVFYGTDLDDYIGKEVAVKAIWLNYRREEDSITIATGDTVATLWGKYFESDLVINDEQTGL